jgi:hypothetical protein
MEEELKVLLHVSLFSFSLTSHPEETSCFLVHNLVTVSILYAKSEEPTKYVNVPLCTLFSTQSVAPLRNIRTQRCQLNCEIFLYFSDG